MLGSIFLIADSGVSLCHSQRSLRARKEANIFVVLDPLSILSKKSKEAPIFYLAHIIFFHRFYFPNYSSLLYWGRPMSNSGRLSADMMMMMITLGRYCNK